MKAIALDQHFKSLRQVAAAGLEAHGLQKDECRKSLVAFPIVFELRVIFECIDSGTVSC